MNLDFSFFTADVFSSFVLKGLLFSVSLTLVAIIGGIAIGTVIAMMRLSKKWYLQKPAIIYIDTFRSIPLVMVILWFYLLIPILIGKPIGVQLSAFITFTVFQAAYFAEIVRAGVGSVASGQMNAGYALGLTYAQSMRYIILPQAFRNMLPVFMTQSIVLFQDTSLVYAIGAYDLLKGFEVAGKNFNRPTETYLIAAVLYFVICFTVSRLALRVQKRIQIIR
ncbi:MAG: amino acid ABC transporter permease [Bdellovibrio sp.]|nr:amino acid ABC transporter permease [Bdellovibrio sp.]